MTENTPNKEARGFAVSNREVRQVPLDWRHPKDEDGNYTPLVDRKEYSNNEEEMRDLREDYNLTSQEELDKLFMPDFSKVPMEEMGICAYESTTEGTPISPVFPNTPEGRFELAKHCMESETVFANYKSGIEAWCVILFGEGLALVDMKDGRVEMPLPRQGEAGDR